MKKIGILGEQIVGRWLEIQNFTILQQNWRCRWGEIDIIAQEKNTQAMPSASFAIAFVEVKTRSRQNWDENGLLAVNYTKQQKLWQTASLFLAEYPQLAELPCRFDIALVSYKLLENPLVHAADNLYQISQLHIGQPVALANYQFTIENYLQSAFD
jgi:putative endonuclease